MQTQSLRLFALILLLAAGTAVAAPRTKTHKSSARTKSTSTKKSIGQRLKLSLHKPSQPKGQTAPTPQRITEIQSALGSQGAYQGTPTGQWDDGTVEAMKQFQAAHGLNPSGKLDALTLHKLGLGAATAGQGAPIRDSPSARLTRPPADLQTDTLDK